MQWLCGGSQVGPDAEVVSAPAVLNVYARYPRLNSVLEAVGVGGIFHSGVEINGVEYAYGGGSAEKTGVWRQTPKVPPQGYPHLVAAVPVGWVVTPQRSFDRVLRRLEQEFRQPDYDLAGRNCNHFAAALCYRLLRRHIPEWVNAAADRWAAIQSWGIPLTSFKSVSPAPVPEGDSGSDDDMIIDSPMARTVSSSHSPMWTAVTDSSTVSSRSLTWVSE
eukprot:Hpha_TRINITY_DN16584_c0_g1::TRINITY_DN16584_c0_g1_i1::g.132850::m.132850